MTGLAISKEFNEKIVESLRNSIGMMLPEDKLAELVTKEFNAFLVEEVEWKVEEQRGSWNSDAKMALVTRMSPFRKIVFDLIHTELNDKIRSVLSSPEFNAEVTKVYAQNGGQEVIRASLQERHDQMLRDGIPQMLVTLLTNVMAVSVNEANANLVRSFGPGAPRGPNGEPILHAQYMPQGREKLF